VERFQLVSLSGTGKDLFSLFSVAIDKSNWFVRNVASMYYLSFVLAACPFSHYQARRRKSRYVIGRRSSVSYYFTTCDYSDSVMGTTYFPCLHVSTAARITSGKYLCEDGTRNVYRNVLIIFILGNHSPPFAGYISVNYARQWRSIRLPRHWISRFSWLAGKSTRASREIWSNTNEPLADVTAVYSSDSSDLSQAWALA